MGCKEYKYRMCTPTLFRQSDANSYRGRKLMHKRTWH